MPAAPSLPIERSPLRVRVALIMEVVASAAGLQSEDLLRRDRKRHLIKARSLAMTLARRLTSHGYPGIARYFGRDFTTILFLVKRTEQRCREDLALAAELATLEQACVTAAEREQAQGV